VVVTEEDIDVFALIEPHESEAALAEEPDPDSTPFAVAPLDIIARTLPLEESDRRG
jgi:hypothetical protein